MLRLTTIGPVAIHIGDARVPTANHQACSALLYLTVERGQRVPRRTLVDLFFPEASDEAGAHSLRQLVYRLRKLGAVIDSDPAMVRIPTRAAIWDVDALLTKGWASDEELGALRRGYLADYAPNHSDRFTEWLDQHRDYVSGRLRHLLIGQLKSERAQRRFRALESVARACLALDPLNEEATLAAAESLAMAGAKVEAVALLDNYLVEIGDKAKELKIPPRILRERISDYVVEPDASERIPLVGRERELELVSSIIEQSATGSPRACIVSGPSGIGKTRLLSEACSLAALTGSAIVRGKLYPHDEHRPFAILRDIGPELLDLPGAIGASSTAIATVRGLCGRGPSQFRSVPNGPVETQTVVAELQARVVELVDAIAAEQPLVICLEDGHWMDDASLELLSELLDDRRSICILMAAQRRMALPKRGYSQLGLNEIVLPTLTLEQSTAVLQNLFEEAGLPDDVNFVTSAAQMAGGIPFYLHVLFRNFQLTGDPEAIPPGLYASLVARLDTLTEPSKSVFDAVVILGSHSSESRLALLTELPRYLLLDALRTLEGMGMIRQSHHSLAASHDLFANAARKRMPAGVARLLHRGAATVLESEAGDIEALELAGHWEACGEDALALSVLTRSANRCLLLGRPKEAIALLLSAHKVACADESRTEVETLLFTAYRASQLHIQAEEYALRLDLCSGAHGPELQAQAIDNLNASGKSLTPHKPALEMLASDTSGSIPQRAWAAKLLTIFAEETFDERLARWALASLSDLDQQSYSVQLPRLITETAFGTNAAAIDVAHQICELALRSEDTAHIVERVPNATYALWRCGAVQMAIDYSTKAYAVAKAEKIWTSCAYLSSLIATMRWNSGDTPGAKEWLKTSAEHIRRPGSHGKGQMRYSLGIILALEENDPDAADALLRDAEKIYPRVMENRNGVDHLAYTVRIDLARGATIGQPLVDQLIARQRALQSSGMQDVVADTTIALLKSLGRFAEAETTRSEYLVRWRKDGFPPAPQLRNLRPHHFDGPLAPAEAIGGKTRSAT